MVSVVVLQAGDSTGQRITFVIIGLLLAALALSMLTAWYYRLTDPGPKQKRSARRSGGSFGGGIGSGHPTDPTPGPGWRKRLSSFVLPDNDGTGTPSLNPSSSQKPASAKTDSQQSVGEITGADPTTSRSRSPAPVSDPLSETPKPSKSSDETVSLEGGYYLDLTDIARTQEPPTNVGSLNALDLRQPAPLIDPDEHEVPVPAIRNTESLSVKPDGPGPDPASPDISVANNDSGLSFDEWLAGVEAVEE